MYATEKLPFGSLLYIQNDLSFRVLSRRSTHRYEIANSPLANGCEIVVASAICVVALATRKAQFRTLHTHIPGLGIPTQLFKTKYISNALRIQITLELGGVGFYGLARQRNLKKKIERTS